MSCGRSGLSGSTDTRAVLHLLLITSAKMPTRAVVEGLFDEWNQAETRSSGLKLEHGKSTAARGLACLPTLQDTTGLIRRSERRP